MKKAVVVGALSFIGYHLVQKLLLEGTEVIALDIESTLALSPLNEEKLLLIGRHANFSYYEFESEEAWRDANAQAPEIVYFCLGEPNQYEVPSEGAFIQSAFDQTISFCKKKESRLIMLSSVSAAAPQFRTKSGAWFHSLEQKLEELVPSYAVLRVPTVYGPWQPSFMAYHQLIVSKEADIGDQENREDAIYVEDVAECLYRLGTEQTCGTYYMEHEEAGQWEKGIELLSGSSPVQTVKEEPQPKTGIRYTYHPSCTLQEGLEQQILHMQKYKQLYEESK